MSAWPRALCAPLISLVLLALPGGALADTGDLDRSFDGDGLAYPLGPGGPGDMWAAPVDAVVLANGGALALVNAGSRWEVDKLTPSGELDTSFGDSDGAGGRTGRATLDITGTEFNTTMFTPKALAVSPGGEIAVAGYRVKGSCTSSDSYCYDGMVWRLAADGSPNTAFGTAGRQYLASDRLPAGRNLLPQDVAIDADGRTVVSAFSMVQSSFDFTTQTRLAVMRLTAAGAADATFSACDACGTGYVSLDVGGAFEASLALDGNKVVAAVRSYESDSSPNRWTVVRLSEDGAMDGSFGETQPGVVHLPVAGNTQEPRVLVSPGGDLYVGAAVNPSTDPPSEPEWRIARLDGTGALDPAWGASGVATTGPVGWGDSSQTDLAALALDGDRLVVAGSAYRSNDQPSLATVARFKSDGSLDFDFHADGLHGIPMTAGLSWHDDAFVAVGVDAERRVVGVGFDAGDFGGPDTRDATRAVVARLQEARTAPENLTPPAIEGTVAAGQQLTAVAGRWSGSHLEPFAYSWRVCDNGTDAVTGCPERGTGATFTPNDAQRTRYLGLVVTAANDIGPTVATTGLTQIPGPEGGTPATPPTIAPTGDVAVGTVVKLAQHGTWNGEASDTYSYAWQRCKVAQPSSQDDCFNITLANADSHTVDADDVANGPYLRLTEFIPGGDMNPSATVRAVAASKPLVPPTNTAAPTISPAGDVNEGEALTVSSMGAWTGNPTLARNWQRCMGTAASPSGCADIPNANGESYTTVEADSGRVVRLRVRGTNNDGFVDAYSTGRGVKAPPPPPAPTPPTPTDPTPSDPKPGPANPTPTNPTPTRPSVVQLDTRRRGTMPEVRGMKADEAIKLIEAQAWATVNVVEVVRPKKFTVNGRRIEIGEVYEQSIRHGAALASTSNAPLRIRLAVSAGPKAPAGGIAQGACAAKAIDDLEGLDLAYFHDLLGKKGCRRLGLDMQLGNVAEPTVRNVSQDGKALDVTVTVPRDPAKRDLTVWIRQGALKTGQPSFGADDWALTTDVDNIFGVEVIDRGGPRGSRAVAGARVFVDAAKVDEDDAIRDTNDNGIAVIGGFRPRREGLVTLLVQAEDSIGQKIYGVGQFRTRDRSGRFTTISGETFAVSKGKADLVHNPRPAARSASFGDLFDKVRGFFASLGAGVQRIITSVQTEQERMKAAAKQQAGPVQGLLAGPATGLAAPIRLTTAPVVSAGSANVVAAGSGNVVAAGSGNVVSAGSANVVSAGSANVFGKDTVKSGTGLIFSIPAVVAAGSANVVAAGSGNVIAAGSANVIAAGSANVVAAGSAN